MYAPPWAVLPADWGANETREFAPGGRFQHERYDKIEIDVHYGGGANLAGSVDVPPAQQKLDQAHVLVMWEGWHTRMVHKGKYDDNGEPILEPRMRALAYSLAIGQDGTLYACRGAHASNGGHYSNDFGLDRNRPSNRHGVAVVFILGGDQAPTSDAKDQFHETRHWLEAEHEVGLRLFGHNEVAANGGHSTKCPGPHLTPFVQEFRKASPAISTDPWDKPIPDYARPSWEEARRRGLIVPQSDPEDVLTKMDYMVYQLDRFGF